MKTVINIRGTNGSGKSTLARSFFGEHDAEALLARYETKGGAERWVKGTVNPDLNVCVIGDYSTMAGGLDKVPTFALQFAAMDAALSMPDVETVVAEGVLAATTYGSWAVHAEKLHAEGHRVVWAFLDTPAQLCLARVYERNGGKKVRDEQILGKHEQIMRVREKAQANPAIEVVDINHENAVREIRRLFYV